jgi:plastocyanin
MKPRFIALIAIVLVIVGIAVYAVTRPKTSPDDMSNMPTPSAQSSTAPATANAVSIAGFAFAPANITVKKGTTVTWTNNDSATHTVTSDTKDSHGPSSSQLGKGQTYSFTFATTGTFSYHCEIHPSMKGTVTVTD